MRPLLYLIVLSRLFCKGENNFLTFQCICSFLCVSKTNNMSVIKIKHHRNSFEQKLKRRKYMISLQVFAVFPAFKREVTTVL